MSAHSFTIKPIFLVFLTLLIAVGPLSVQAAQTCIPYTASYGSSGATTNIDGGFAAVPTYISPLWGPAFAGASWIWDDQYVSNPEDGEVKIFRVTFSLPGPVSSSTLLVSVDDYVTAELNGTAVASEFGEGNFLPENIHTYHTPQLFTVGENELVFEVTNAPYFYPGQATPQNNPAGLLFTLLIEGDVCTTVAGTTNTGGGGTVISGPLAPGYQTPTPAPTAAQNIQSNGGAPQVLGTQTENTASVSSPTVEQDEANTAETDTENAGWFGCLLKALLLILCVIALWMLVRRLGGRFVEHAELPTYALASTGIILFLWYVGESCPLAFFVVGMLVVMAWRALTSDDR